MKKHSDTNLHPLEETHPHLKEFTKLLPELNKESDRGMVLISANYLDDLLHQILKSYFIKGKTSTSLTEGFNAPLGSFATRSAMTLALGLISEREFKETELIRKVRNKFAHQIHISFEDHSIKDVCNKLTMAIKNDEKHVINSRGQFSSSALCLILNLTNRPHYVSEQRREFKMWPY